MAPVVRETQTPVPHAELGVLEAHLPHSYSLLRRCQFTHRPRGTSEHAHFLFATASDPHFDTAKHPQHFAAAYVDLSKSPETEVILYSTLQDHENDEVEVEVEVVDHVLDLIVALFARIRAIARHADASGAYPLRRPQGALVGCLHEGTYRLLLARRGLTSSYWNPHDVWLFRLDQLPRAAAASSSALCIADEATSSASAGGRRLQLLLLRWDVVRREDCALIASRTNIPKVADTLMSEPSVVVRHAETLVAVAWGFMGIAGTLSTLHVEEPYRGRGMAKAVAVKVLTEHSFGDDGWGACFALLALIWMAG